MKRVSGVGIVWMTRLSLLAMGAVFGWLLADGGGALLGILAGASVPVALMAIADVWHWHKPLRPKCVNGVCASGDYRSTGVHISELGRRDRGGLVVPCDGVFTSCKCGIEYFHPMWRLGHDDRFYVVGPNGLVPYMKAPPFRGWRRDPESAGLKPGAV